MKSRRGLSTVVGMVFAIVALTSTVVYVSYSMNTLGQFGQTIVGKTQQSLDVGKESFRISNIEIDNNLFNITVVNTGNIPINFTKLWVTNSSSTSQTWTRSYVPVNNFVGPGATLTNIGQHIPLSALSNKAYTMKLVTSRGNTQQFSINSQLPQNLFVQFNAIPNQIPEGFTTTLVMTVVNNMSNNQVLLNLTPSLVNGTVSNPTADIITQIGSSPQSYKTLQPGGVAIFKWVYKLQGNNNDVIVFTGGLKNLGKTVSDSVTLSDVSNAAQSQTSLQSLGITCCRTNDNLLVLHQENFNTAPEGGLGNAYQMYSGQTDASGTTIEFNKPNSQANNMAYFITENDTIIQTDINKGPWSLTLRARSDLMPNVDSLQSNYPDMAWLFNTSPVTGQVLKDSSGCVMTMTQGANAISANTTTNDGSFYMNFLGNSGTSYLSVNLDSKGGPGANAGCHGDDEGKSKSTTLGWFRIPSAPSTGKYIIYRAEGSTQKPPQWLEISMVPGGYVSFNFFIKNSPAKVTCQTTGGNAYAGQSWHFFTAVRQGEQCTLYMDGSQVAANTTSTNQGDSMTLDQPVYIGQSPTTTIQPYYNLVGQLDTIMHWNSIQLSSQQINDIYTKNYGNKAHVITFTASRTNQYGTPYSGVSGSILNATTATIPFLDGLSVPTKWVNYTITTPTQIYNGTDLLQQFHVTPQSRMLLNVTYVGGSNNALNPQALPLHWRIDDTLIPDAYSSYLLLPQVTFPFPSYYTVAHNAQVTFTASNAGPNGFWLTYGGTRVIFQAVTNSTASYAGVIQKANNTNVNSAQDSMFLQVGNKAVIQFTQASTIPGGPGPNLTPGSFRMYVSITGYDNTGAVISRVFYIGVVRVT